MYMSQTWRTYKPKKTLSLPTKRFISNLAYFLVHSLILFVSYKTWNVQMFGEIWFYVMHVSTFYFVRLALVTFGVRV
jgi:hypothetical protein